VKQGPDLHDAAALRLARLEQRYTRVRRGLVEVMAEAERPLTIPEILSVRPDLTQSSAYRNITTLIEAGVARRVAGSDDHGRFELAEELSGQHHHHLVCENCGKVSDVAPSPSLERALAQAARAASDQGYQVTDHRFDLVGYCPDCR